MRGWNRIVREVVRRRGNGREREAKGGEGGGWGMSVVWRYGKDGGYACSHPYALASSDPS